jgi:hypothetical protein
MADLVAHTSLPWKPVQSLKLTTPGGLIYTSIEPVNVTDDCGPLKMADGSYHVCRFSHTSNERSAVLHRANAEFIALACNSHYRLFNALNSIEEEIFAKGASLGSDVYFKIRELARLRNGGANG